MRRRRLLTATVWSPLDAAFMLNRRKDVIKDWLRNGLPSVKVAGRRYIRPQDATAWSAKHARRTTAS